MLTESEIKSRINAIHGENLTLVSKYSGMNVLHKFRGKCNHTWEASPSNVINNKSGCPVCWKERRALLQRQKMKSHEQYVKDLKALHPSIEVMEPYRGALIPISHRCLDCNSEYMQRPNSWLMGSGCEFCSYISRGKVQSKKSEKALREWFHKTFKGSIKLIDYNAGSLIGRFHCSDCDNAFNNDRWDFRWVRPWCPNCNKPPNHKGYVFPSGREELVLGYEPFALDLLLADGVKEQDITCGRTGRHVIPVFEYELGGRNRRYYPDIMIRNDHILEVKGLYWFAGTKDLFEMTALKAKTVSEHYRFTLLLFNDYGTRIPLPANWFELPYSKIRKISYGI